jgi:hypothetical protein
VTPRTIRNPDGILYRTPKATRATIIGLLALDIVVFEVILQTLIVIPALLQGLIVLLVGGLAFGVTIGLSSFVAVRGGPGWIEVQHGVRQRIEAADISYTRVLGPFPWFCSVSMYSRSGGPRVRVGALAVRSERVRGHLHEMVTQGIDQAGLTLSPAACRVLGVSNPAPADFAGTAIPVVRLVVTALATFAFVSLSMRRALEDSWGPPLAMGLAAAVLGVLYFWWITGPIPWSRG